MANEDLTQVTNAINSGAQSTTNSVESLEQSSTSNLNALSGQLSKDGIKLTTTQKQIEKDINSMGDYFKDMISYLMSINTNLLELKVDKENNVFIAEEETLESKNSSEEGEAEEEETTEEEDSLMEKELQKLKIDTGAKDASVLNTQSTLADLTGTGFSLLNNSLQSIAVSIVEGMGQMTSLMVDMMTAVTQASQEMKPINNEREEGKEGTEVTTGNKLKAYFEQLTGPLNSVASGMLLLATSMAILGTIGFSASLIGNMILLETAMVFTFITVSKIAEKYLEIQPLMDPESDTSNNLSVIANTFLKMVMAVGLSFTISLALVNVLKSNLLDVVLGLVATFGILTLSVLTMGYLSSIALPEVEEGSNMDQMIKAFTTIVATITAVALLCSVAWGVISIGLIRATMIIGLAAVTLTMLVSQAQQLKEIPQETLDAFNGMLTRMIVMISIISIVAVVLGILPESIILQGIISVGLISGLVMGLIATMVHGVNKIKEIEEGILTKFMAIMIIATAMVTILSVLAILLAQQDPVQLLLAVGIMAVMASIPLVILKITSKINASDATKGLAGIAIAGIVAIAISGLAWIVLSTLGQFTMDQLLVATVAFIGMAGLMLVVTGFIALMGIIFGALISGPQASLIPLALLGIVVAGAVALAIAGFANLLVMALPVEIATQSIVAAKALILISAALVITTTSIITLGALAIPLMLSSGLALLSITMLTGFITSFAGHLTTISDSLSLLDEGTQESIKAGIVNMVKTIPLFTGIVLGLVPLASLIGIVMLTVPLALLSLGYVTSAVLGISLSMQALSSIELPTWTDDNNPLGTLKTSMGYLGEFIRTVNSLPSLKLTSTWNTIAAIDAAETVQKKLNKIADVGSLNKIASLTQNLNDLANTSTGLDNLANALGRVAQATNDLNAVSSATAINAVGVERLTGSLNQRFDTMQNIQESHQSTINNNNSLKVDLKELKQPLETVIELLKELRVLQLETTENTKDSAEAVEFNSRSLSSV